MKRSALFSKTGFFCRSCTTMVTDDVPRYLWRWVDCERLTVAAHPTKKLLGGQLRQLHWGLW
jgi:hypothetical protein